MNGEEVYVYHYGTHTNGTRTTNANLFIAVYEATLDEINKRPFYEIA
jgi:hypothetical protein